MSIESKIENHTFTRQDTSRYSLKDLQEIVPRIENEVQIELPSIRGERIA